MKPKCLMIHTNHGFIKRWKKLIEIENIYPVTTMTSILSMYQANL